MILEGKNGRYAHVTLLSKTNTHVKVRRAHDDAVINVSLASLVQECQDEIARWKPASGAASRVTPWVKSVYGPSKGQRQRAARCVGGICKPPKL